MHDMRRYLKKYLDKIVFLDFDVQKTETKQDVSFLKDTPLPVSIDSIQSEMISKADIEKVPFETFVHGMIYILGIDKDFKFNKNYKKFLLMTNEKIVEFIIYNGIKLAEENKTHEALVYFRAALYIDSKDLNALYNYSKACKDIFNTSEVKEEKEDFLKESISYFKTTTQEHKEFAPAYYYLGFLYSNQKMFENAKAVWETYINLADDFETKDEIRVRLSHVEDMVIYEIGYNLILDGNFQEGLDKLLPLTLKDEDWWNLYFFIGLAYRNLQGYDKAITNYKKVLLLKPSQPDTNNELGLCYTNIGDFEKAEKYLKKALMLTVDDPEIMSNLAVVYMNIENYGKAQELLEKAQLIAPDDKIIQMWMAKLQGLRDLN